jgi:carbon-monoxide dehydrogenase medium subunit
MTRQRDIELDEIVRLRCPLMHEAILQVGHRQTRNRGTLGGSLCHLDPSAELVSVAAALDATVRVEGINGAREIPFGDFPAGLMTPALREHELVTSVRFALWQRGHGHAFIEFARRHGDFAIVSAAALLEEDGRGKITRASLTLGGVAPAPVRMREVEKALTGSIASAKLFREVAEACRNLEVIEDLHAPAAYRRQLAAVLSRRALQKAHENHHR